MLYLNLSGYVGDILQAADDHVHTLLDRTPPQRSASVARPRAEPNGLAACSLLIYLVAISHGSVRGSTCEHYTGLRLQTGLLRHPSHPQRDEPDFVLNFIPPPFDSVFFLSHFRDFFSSVFSFYHVGVKRGRKGGGFLRNVMD